MDVPETLPLDPSVVQLTRLLSGEGRFRWLHARPGAEADLLAAAEEAHAARAWVVPVQQVVDDGWLGPTVLAPARARLGDVAVVARDPVSFDDPGGHRRDRAAVPPRLADRGRGAGTAPRRPWGMIDETTRSRDVRSERRPAGAVEQPEVARPRSADLPPRRTWVAAPDVESIESPAKVMRIGSMVKQLLDEVRAAPLDERSRERMAEIYGMSVEALASALSPDLQAELRQLAPPFPNGQVPTEAELRVAQAQLVGWLEGLFHGIQATLFAQQLAARQQLDQMRGQLMPGQVPPGQATPRPGPPWDLSVAGEAAVVPSQSTPL